MTRPASNDPAKSTAPDIRTRKSSLPVAVVRLGHLAWALVCTSPVMAQPAKTPPIPDGYVGGPYKVIAADFTGDRQTDLVIGYRSIGVVAVKQGNGKGQLTSLPLNAFHVAQPHGERHVHNLDHADLDSDGLDDLAFTVGGRGPDHPGYVLIARNLGGGKFETKCTFQTPSEAKGIRLADLDNDGRNDLIYTARGSGYKGDIAIGQLLIRQGIDDWKFGAALKASAGKSAYYADTADLNNDGYLDIVVPNEHDATVTYFLNPGKTLFPKQQTLQPRRLLATRIPGKRSHAVNDARAADLNGDGNADVLTANLGTSTISIFFGNGDGTFAKDTLLDAGKNGAFLAVGDLDADGDLDFVVTHWTEDFLSVFLNNGRGQFPHRSDYHTASGNYGVTLTDLNHDRRLDAVTANYRDRSISVLLGNGDGTLAKAITIDSGLRSRGGRWTPE